MSPEGAAHAIKEYVQMLEHQVRTAEAFFFGRLAQGMEGLLKLPDEVREKVDQLLWEKTGGEPLNATEEESQILIAAALMHSLEEGVGIIS